MKLNLSTLLFFTLLLLPILVFAQDGGLTPSSTSTYQDEAGTSQMIADSFKELWGFFFDDVPTMMQRFFAWAIIRLVKVKIYLQLESMKFAWGVAKVIIQDLNIMSQITAQMSGLPVDVRQALVDMRLIDALNLVFQAYVTKFVMGIFN